MTKREYAVQVTFEPSKSNVDTNNKKKFKNNFFLDNKGVTSSSLIWKITGYVNGEDVVLVERPISGNVRPGLIYTLFYNLAFGYQSEGVRLNFKKIFCSQMQ